MNKGEADSTQVNTNRKLRFYALDYASMVGFMAYSSSVTATPICLLAISRELSLSLKQAGGLESTRSVLLVGTLLVSGFIAGRLGKVRAIGWSCILLGVGMVWYSFTPSYGILLLAIGLLGVGGGVVEALTNPLVQELHPEDSGRYLNITNAFWSFGMVLTMLSAGELLSRNVPWRSIIAGLGTLSFISGILFLSLPHAATNSQRQSMSSVFDNKRAIIGSRGFWYFNAMMFFAAAVEGAFTFWSATLMQLHLGAVPRAAGMGAALFAGGMIIARLVFGWLVPQEKLGKLILVSAVFGLGVSAIIPVINEMIMAYLGLFLAGVSVACFWPSLQSYAVDRLPLDPTGVFIFLSCGGVSGFALISWVMGAIGDLYSLRVSFWIIPICFVALIGLLLFERKQTWINVQVFKKE